MAVDGAAGFYVAGHVDGDVVAEGLSVEGVEERGAGWGDEMGDGDRQGGGGVVVVIVGEETGLEFGEDSGKDVGWRGEDVQEHPASGGDGVR